MAFTLNQFHTAFDTMFVLTQDWTFQVRVRSTATEAKPVQKAATSSTSSDQQMATTECMGMLNQLLSKWCPKEPLSLPPPKEPEPCKLECPIPVPPVPLPTAQGNTDKTSALVEAAVPEQAKPFEDQKKDNLEAYENQAFEALARKTPKAKSAASKAKPAAVTKCQVLKRPAAAKAKAVPKTLGKDKYGCSRCRGAPKGCNVCIQPTYKGLILNGHAVWKAWHEKNHKK